MRAVRVGAAVIALMGGSPAAAQYFDTGNELLSICNRRDGGASMLCMGIVSGIADMMMASGYKCNPGAPITRQQAQDVAVKYLRDHPETRHGPAVFSVILAMQKDFDCERK